MEQRAAAVAAIRDAREAARQANSLRSGQAGRQHFAVLSLSGPEKCGAALAVAAGARLPPTVLPFGLLAKGSETFAQVQTQLAALAAEYGEAIPVSGVRWVLSTASRRYLDLLRDSIEGKDELRDPSSGSLAAA